MKKILLLLLLVSIGINAQAPSPPPPYELCNYSGNDGTEVFNLTTMVSFIINVMNPATTQVSFHETLADSQANTNAIPDPTNYTNIIPNSQTIFIRVTDTPNSQVFFLTMELIVTPIPNVNPGFLTFCDPTELAIYNLHDADNQIMGGAPNLTIAYYETIVDAQVQANQILSPYIPIVQGTQILYANVQNPLTGCSAITTLTLNTHNCGSCPAPTDLVATNVTNTTLTLSWDSSVGGVTAYSVACVVPLGEAPSDNGAVVTSTGPGPYTFTGLSPNTCYSLYVKTFCNNAVPSEWSAPLDICLTDCSNSGDCSQALVLTAFLDSNNNGVKDIGETNFNNGNFVYQINDSGNNLYGTSNNGSYYIFDANPSNSYDISFAVNAALSPYYTSTVVHNNITLPTGSGANSLYFPVLNPIPHVDARVTLYPNGQPRPGFTYGNTICYQNFGSQTIANGTLTFTKDSNVSITAISQAGTVATGNGFTYDFTNLAPFETRFINVTLLVPTIPTVNLGDLITNNTTVQVNGEIELSDNSYSVTQAIVGSYDPNDKSESHGGKIVHGNFTLNDYLYYTIRFENTGSASTEFIRVEDALDSQLDENSFEMLTASHPVNTRRTGNQLVWHFYDAQVPPTSVDPQNSHGYVHFRIKPKPGYAIGTIIPNAASIYFDYNPAIVTEAFNTEFVQSMGNSAFNADTIAIYPNPTINSVTITNSNSVEKISKITIYDVAGKRIYTLSNNNLNSINLDVSQFSKGIYMVEITSESNLKLTKKLIIK